MNLRQLRYFCEVVEAGNTRVAASRLFVAPTAISMQLAQLEQTLGGRLFDRGSRPMALTSLGRFVYPKARELLSQAARLADEAKGLASGNLGWLSIGFTRSTIYSLLPEAVRQMKLAFPLVRIDLAEVLSEHQADSLRSGAIHVGVSRAIGAVSQQADLAYTPLIEDPMVAVLPSAHPLAARKSIRAADLDALAFISYPKDPQSRFAQQALAMLQDAGANPQVGYEAKEIHTALGLVAAGLGATIVGRTVSANNRADLRFVPIRDLRVCASVFAVRRRDEPNVLADAFLRILLAQCAPLTVPAAPRARSGRSPTPGSGPPASAPPRGKRA